MSEVKKIATRESYGNALVELGKLHDDVVVLDADLAGATKTGMFKKAFPERFIDCGIAEGNMIGVAAGIATTGKVPFASTFAMFASGRALQQDVHSNRFVTLSDIRRTMLRSVLHMQVFPLVKMVLPISATKISLL